MNKKAFFSMFLGIPGLAMLGWYLAPYLIPWMEYISYGVLLILWSIICLGVSKSPYYTSEEYRRLRDRTP